MSIECFSHGGQVCAIGCSCDCHLEATPTPEDYQWKNGFEHGKLVADQENLGKAIKDMSARVEAIAPQAQPASEGEIMAMMVKVREYWTTQSGEPDLRGFSEYVLALLAQARTEARRDEVKHYQYWLKNRASLPTPLELVEYGVARLAELGGSDE